MRAADDTRPTSPADLLDVWLPAPAVRTHNRRAADVDAQALWDSAQTLRLSMVYGLLDGAAVIDEAHLRAALALWSYADQSARNSGAAVSSAEVVLADAPPTCTSIPSLPHHAAFSGSRSLVPDQPERYNRRSRRLTVSIEKRKRIDR